MHPHAALLSAQSLRARALPLHLILLWRTAGFDAALGLGHHHRRARSRFTWLASLRELFAREGVASQQLQWKIKQALTKSNFLRPGILVDAERRHAYC